MIGDFAPLPAGKFGVILADPPWRFVTWSAKGEGKSPQRHYGCLPVDAIAALPVASIAARDCALFLWATWPTMPQAFALIDAWGFEYSGLGWEWCKYNGATDRYAFGGGLGGTRKNVEPCLLARRGRPKRLANGVRDLLFAKRREHSRKPDEQYERCQALYAGPYLELFARQAWPGWAAWGNQKDKFDPAHRVAAYPATSHPGDVREAVGVARRFSRRGAA
jgi:N6-adenosine-specific RNA methylase IME4